MLLCAEHLNQSIRENIFLKQESLLCLETVTRVPIINKMRPDMGAEKYRRELKEAKILHQAERTWRVVG